MLTRHYGRKSLSEFNLPVTGCVVNRMTPDLDHPFIQTRRANERKNVSELEKGLPGLKLHEVELKDSDIHGIEALRGISKELHGNFKIKDGLGPFKIGIGLEVHRGTWVEGDDVYLHLPWNCKRRFVFTQRVWNSLRRNQFKRASCTI